MTDARDTGEQYDTTGGSTNGVQSALSQLNLRVSSPVSPPNSWREESTCYQPVWKDITAFLDEVTQEFGVGQLIHPPSFSLFEAMSAIEIMDPKMDSGMVLKTDSEKEPFNPFELLTPSQVLFVVDKLTACETTWLAGQPLSQTIFTCLYTHHVVELTDQSVRPPLTNFSGDEEQVATSNTPPPQLVWLTLKAYVLGVLKCSQAIWVEMTKGNIYEEEDFTTNKQGLSFSEHILGSTVINLLDDAYNWSVGPGRVEILRLYEGDEKEINAFEALINRIQMRKSFLLALTYLSAEPFMVPARTKESLLTTLECMEKIRISIIPTTELQSAFDSTIHRKLAAQAPPRPVTLHTTEEAYEFLTCTLQRLVKICGVVEYKSCNSLMNFFSYFASQKPYPCPFSRSKLNSIFCPDQRIFNTLPLSHLLRDSISEFFDPPKAMFEISSDKPEQLETTKLLADFLERASRPYADRFKIMCHNRARQRRILRKILPDFECCQEEAEQIDSNFQNTFQECGPVMLNGSQLYPYYISSWFYHEKLRIMQEILYLGFELELYALHEYTMIYWYLDYILGVHLQHIERTANVLSLRPNTIKTLKKSKKKQKSMPTVSSHGNSPSPSLAYLRSIALMTSARQNLSRGIYKIIISLDQAGKLRRPSPDFDDESIRFLHRFRMFSMLSSPPPLSYQDYRKLIELDGADTKVLPEGILKSADHDFKDARAVLDNLNAMNAEATRTELCNEDFVNDVRSMTRTAIANNINLQQILSELSKSDSSDTEKSKKVCFEFKYHPWFPVVNFS
ncbi:uncharacterized protein VTP21DRAFT_11505 [Calcarisporiella thermophila]|uniref:uncharacterized protein n=1 Tax=Calcarisporiella thermophila TaxID=911321 RepID=UPI0037438664